MRHEGALTGGEKTSLAFWLEECWAGHSSENSIDASRVATALRIKTLAA
jgi:hypothetical protein